MLKCLYCLMQSSLSYDVSRDDYGTMAIGNGRLKFQDMTALSNMLFEELHQRLSFGLHTTSIDRYVRGAALHADPRDSLEELLLLLRCCILIVRLHPDDHTLMQKFLDAVFLRPMLPLRGTLIERGSISFTKVASAQSMHSSCSASLSNDLHAKSCDSCIHLLKRMLEVILDDMSADRQFRERIAMLYTFASAKGNQSTCSSIHIESMLDVITAHFILSISGEQFLETYTQSLIWTKKETFCNPELSFSAATSLVKDPLMSPPILLRAHMISLVSEVIGICDSHDVTRNMRYTDYLSVFRDSVIMYCEHLSKLLAESCDSPYKLRRSSRRAVKPHFHSEIYDKVNFMLASCDSSWRAHVGNISAKGKSSLEIDAITYLKMNMFIFDESSRDEMFSFLSSLIIKVISSEADETLYLKIKKLTMQEFCLLASILKLMSCSLLRATCLKKRFSLELSSKRNDEASAIYHSVLEIVSYLVKRNLHVPVQVQQLIDDALKPRNATHDDCKPKMILMHFAGLLSLCTVTGLNFLVKGCIFTTMVFLNMVLEEESLEFVRPSSNACLELHSVVPSTANLTSVPTKISHEDSFGKIEKCRVRQMSCLKVASDFQRIRKLLLRDRRADDKAETINGEVYLKHFTSDPDVISELADFIVCKPEKNYTAWLRNRAESRHKRIKKLARRQWQRKKAVCNSMGKRCTREITSKILRSRN
uniref:DUF7812 domain-containing protein n=2 Tax=Opuntia streptacantha TaxID=393608 RepID=A0A7C9DM77_OPUST